MAIDEDKFLSWIESRFDDFVIRGNEIKINSIFVEDYKRHLWCNPKGGKKERENGCFRCFKTDRVGSLVTLVMLVDKCSYEDAVETLDAVDTSLANIEARLDAVFNPVEKVEFNPLVDNTLKLPDNTYIIDEMDPEDFWRITAEGYLFSRKLATHGLMICVSGNYRNRIIIPYYDTDGKLIYFNARSMSNNKEVLRYMGPPKEVGIGKEDVLYVPYWPKWGRPLYLTEGEFDAIALWHSGRVVGESLYTGAFGGKSLSDKQAEMLRPYDPLILCLDADKAGKSGLINMAQKLHAFGKRPYYVRPPEKYKDWNKMLEIVGEKIVVHYLLRNIKPLDDRELLKLMV